MSPKLIIADDHPLILKGLHDFLVEKNYNVIDNATNGEEALALITRHDPDIAVLDIRMPKMNGLEVAEICKSRNLNTKIVLITFEKDESLLNKAKQLNVSGYILKEFALVEIENCIKSIMLDEPYFSPELSNLIEIQKAPKEIELLTETEKKILKLIANNKIAPEIAKAQKISTRTVEKHRSNIIKKLNLKNQANGLVLWVTDNEKFL